MSLAGRRQRLHVIDVMLSLPQSEAFVVSGNLQTSRTGRCGRLGRHICIALGRDVSSDGPLIVLPAQRTNLE